uniref:Uncharacterized protein n=1 Tax=Amphimedon queenslandica TaxID=400682 RepID=A0A1X7USX7_AMPQE
PLHLIRISHSETSTSESSRFTKRRRSEQLANIREILSIGDSEEQLADEIKKVPAEALIKEINFTITVPPEQKLALKSDLCLPWRKLRVMRSQLRKPNSIKNSCVFAVFEGPDLSTNLQIALSRFQEQVSDIQKSHW